MCSYVSKEHPVVNMIFLSDYRGSCIKCFFLCNIFLLFLYLEATDALQQLRASDDGNKGSFQPSPFKPEGLSRVS
jgi:hypothetical protein